MITCCWRKPKEQPIQLHQNPVYLTRVQISPGHLDLTKILQNELEIGSSGEIPSARMVYSIDPNEQYDPRNKV